LQEEREIITCSQRQIFLGEVFLSKPSFGQPDYMVCFSLVVDNSRIGIVNNHFDLAPHRLRHTLTDFNYPLLDQRKSIGAERSYRTLHEKGIRENIEGMPTLHVSDRKNKTFSVVHVARLNCLKRLENLI
jgi:hypothetical protein